MLFPHDYGAQASGRSIHCCYRSNRGNGDWEEWQVETLAAMILLPPECVVRSMERFGLGTQMRLLNRVFAPADYKKFEAIASFMGASKTALSIRMTQLAMRTTWSRETTKAVDYTVVRCLFRCHRYKTNYIKEVTPCCQTRTPKTPISFLLLIC